MNIIDESTSTYYFIENEYHQKYYFPSPFRSNHTGGNNCNYFICVIIEYETQNDY